MLAFAMKHIVVLLLALMLGCTDEQDPPAALEPPDNNAEQEQQEIIALRRQVARLQARVEHLTQQLAYANENQRQLQQKLQQHQASQRRQAPQRRPAREEPARQTERAPSELSIVSCQFRGGRALGANAGRYYLQVDYTLRNNTRRTITSFKGVVSYRDQFGDVLHRHEVSETATIPPRRSVVVREVWIGFHDELPRAFNDAHKGMVVASFETLRVLP